MKNIKYKMVGQASRLSIIICLALLFLSSFAYSQNSDPTIMMLQSDITKQEETDAKRHPEQSEGSIKCSRCDTEVLESSKYCSNCGKLLKKTVVDELARQEMRDELIGFFGPKLGVYVPMNSEMRDVYSDGLIYGVNFQIWWREWASILEISKFDQERVLPITKTQVKNATTEGDWKYANTNLGLTFLYVSCVWAPSFLNIKGSQLQNRIGVSPVNIWKGYFGLGAGATLVSERFRGERYAVTNEWLYASVTTREVLTAYQILIGFINEGRLSFDVRYNIIPTRSNTGFSDLNGLSLSISLFF